MKLNNLIHNDIPKKARKRVGRGIGSGLGKTCGKGHKGQKARTGFSRRFAFEGGQTSLYRRIPKSGFTALKDNYYTEELTLGQLSLINQGIIDLDRLKKEKIIRHRTSKIRILNKGELTHKIHIMSSHGDLYLTKGSREALEVTGSIIEEV